MRAHGRFGVHPVPVPLRTRNLSISARLLTVILIVVASSDRIRVVEAERLTLFGLYAINCGFRRRLGSPARFAA